MKKKAYRPTTADALDVVTLTYEEADVLEFLAGSFLDDHKGDRHTFGSAQREAYGRKVVAMLQTFTEIEKRCGVIGIEDSIGDRPRCSRLPHEDPLHRSLDIYTMRPLTWEGDRVKDYLADLVPAGRTKVTRTKTKSRRH